MAEQEFVIVPPSDTDVSQMPLLTDMQFLDPYGSESINRKFFGIIPPGIYRGFKYALPGAMKLRIGLPNEPGTAVVQCNNVCITIQQRLAVDLTVAAGFSGLVVLTGFYQFGVPTKQTHTLSTQDAAKIELIRSADLTPNQVILYTVNVPAGTTTLTSAMITTARRQDVSIAVESDIYQLLTDHIGSPTAHTKAQVGLNNVNNWPATAAVNDPSDTKYATAGAVKKAHDLADAALPKSGGVVDGKVVVGPIGFDSYGWPNATDRDQNNYVSRSRLMVRAGNNGLSMFGTASENARRFGLQVGHSDGTYASAVGTLELNPYGGAVLINGGRAYHTGYKPTADDVLAMPVKKAHLADWTSAPGMASKTYVGGYQSPDSVPSYLAFGAAGQANLDIFLDGEYYANQGRSRVYHEAFRPTPADIGALPTSGGVITNALTVNGLFNAEGGFQVSGVNVIGTSNTTVRLGDGEFERDLNLNAKNALAFVQYGSGRHRIYHEGYKPSPGALGTYNQQEIDDKVNDAGFKTVTIAAPAGVEAGKFYPIVVSSSIEGRQELYVSTRSSGGSDPMNNCSFHGIVRAAGWSDKTSYVNGQFTIYTDGNERAIHSIAMPSESEGAYAIYVEARAFPVQLRLPIRCGVACTGQDMQFGTTTFSAGVSSPGGTKVQIKADFSKGSGHYFNSNKAYHEGFRPSADDINALDIRGTNAMSGNLNIHRPANDAGVMVKGGDGKNAWLKLVEGTSLDGADYGMYMHYNGATDNVGRIGMINNNVWVDSIILSRDTGAIDIEKPTTAKARVTIQSASDALRIDAPSAVSSYILGSTAGVANWWVGRGGSSNDVSLYSYAHSNYVEIKADRVVAGKNLYVGNSKVYHEGSKPTPEDIGATSREVYVGEGFRNLGSLQSKVGEDYFYNWYKLCEHTTSALIDTTFDVIISADKNYAGSTGRYFVTVSRYEGNGDPVGSYHVGVTLKYGAPDMIELAVKKEVGKTTVYMRGKRMWGNIGVSVINRATDGGKPSWIADGTRVLSNDPVLSGTVKLNCGDIYDGDTGKVSYDFNQYFSKVHDSGARVFSPNNKPSLENILGGTLTGNMNVTGWIEAAGTFKSTANNALAIVAERGGHQAAMGCSQTAGEYIFGGKTAAASDYQHYIRLGNNKFEYHQNGSNFDVYHAGNKPTADDVNAVARNGSSTMTGTLVVDYNGYGVHIKRDSYPGIMLESKGLTSHRQKLIEVNNGGHLTFITRNDRAENNGVVVLEAGKSGTIYHTGNKPTPDEIGAFKASCGSVTNQDWNTLTVAGSYSVDNASGENKPAIIGHPTVYTYGTLFVQNNGRTISQMYITDGNKIYLRDKYSSNAWGTWTSVSNDESTDIKTSVDLDDLSCDGTFNMYKGSGVTFTNAPSDFDYGTLRVIGRGRATSSFVTQVLTWRSNGRQMIRTRNDGAMAWTPWRKIYSESQKPTAADVEAVSKSGDEMTGGLKISGTADNTVPSVDQVKLDGYGVMGNRGTVYVTNGSTASNAAVALGIGGAHAADIKLLIEKLKVTSNVDLYERGNRVYSPANKPEAADVGAAPTYEMGFSPSGYRWMCVGRIAKSDNSATMIISGAGDFGGTGRDTITLSIASRNNAVNVDANRAVRTSNYSNPTKIYTKDTGSAFELWIEAASYQHAIRYTLLSATGWVDMRSGLANAKPDGLVEHQIGVYYTSINKPTAADVGAFPKTGGNIAGNVMVSHDASAEHSIGTARAGRRFYMYDNGGSVGLYSFGFTGVADATLIARHISTGTIQVGDGNSPLELRGTQANYDGVFTGHQIRANHKGGAAWTQKGNASYQVFGDTQFAAGQLSKTVAQNFLIPGHTNQENSLGTFADGNDWTQLCHVLVSTAGNMETTRIWKFRNDAALISPGGWALNSVGNIEGGCWGTNLSDYLNRTFTRPDHNHYAKNGIWDVIYLDMYAIGSYMMATLKPSAGSNCTPGTAVAGANLHPAGACQYSENRNITLPGTWRCQGAFAATNSDDQWDDRTTLWIRII